MYYRFILLLMLGVLINTKAGDIRGKIKSYDEPLENVVVSLVPIVKTALPVPRTTAVMDQVNLTFIPHVLPVVVGTKVRFPNSDKIRHSVFSNSRVKRFDFGTYAPGTEKFIVCEDPGIISIMCYIHHDMSAYIVVLETEYFGVSDEQGNYEIKNIPGGEYMLRFWHEDVEIAQQQVKIPAKGQIIKNISQE